MSVACLTRQTYDSSCPTNAGPHWQMGRIDGTLGVSGRESNEHQPKCQDGLHAPGARRRAGRKELVGRATRRRVWDRIVLRAKMKTVSICRHATAARSSDPQCFVLLEQT